jgi:FtsH-binding integral membrane protein
MAQARAISTVSEERVNRFVAQVFFLMSLGLVVTALVSVWVSDNLRLLWKLNTNPWIAFGLFFVQIVIVVALSAAVMRLAPGVAALLFFLYSGLTGLTISSIFLVYTAEDISSVFWITAGTFFLTSLFGLLLKRDLSAAGNVLFMLLLGWLVAWTFSLFFPESNINWLLNFVGIALFVGLTAYDSQKIRQIGEQIQDHPARGGLIVLGALTLYLDFINLFLLILRASSRR